MHLHDSGGTPLDCLVKWKFNIPIKKNNYKFIYSVTAFIQKHFSFIINSNFFIKRRIDTKFCETCFLQKIIHFSQFIKMYLKIHKLTL